MLDHTGVSVSDYAPSKRFYEAALKPLGFAVIMEFPRSTGSADVAGFGVSPKPEFWIASGVPNRPAIHIAFRANRRAMVDEFYNCALAAGGTDNGPPGIRAHYHPNYYGAFILDPDGHNIEVVCHEPTV